MSKYTQGKWEARSNHIYAEDTNLHIADICKASDGEWSEANARLIAAAPELLEALKEIKKLAKFSMIGSDKENKILNIAEQAIAKAEGNNV